VGYIEFTIHDKIASIQLNKAEKLNALDHDLLNELSDCLTKLEEDTSVKALFITGNTQAFCAGGDLNYMAKMNQYDAREASRWIQHIFNQIEALPFFTIAVIEGIAFGGGLELALGCDIRIASENAQFALPEMRYGIIPAGGGTRRFQEHAGYANCMYTMSANKILSANDALNQGIIQELVRSEEMTAFLDKYKQKIATYTIESIYDVKALVKSAMSKSRQQAFRDEAELFGKLMEREGSKKIQSFFESKQNKQ
jgi:enoyl-CoA hydratase